MDNNRSHSISPRKVLRDQVEPKMVETNNVSRRIEAIERNTKKSPKSNLFSNTVLGQLLAEKGMQSEKDFQVRQKSCPKLVEGQLRKKALERKESSDTQETCSTHSSSSPMQDAHRKKANLDAGSHVSDLSEMSSSTVSFYVDIPDDHEAKKLQEGKRPNKAKKEALRKQVEVMEEKVAMMLETIMAVQNEMKVIKEAAFSANDSICEEEEELDS